MCHFLGVEIRVDLGWDDRRELRKGINLEIHIVGEKIEVVRVDSG